MIRITPAPPAAASCCVACGRPAGPEAAACPYCGEAVRERPARRRRRLAVLCVLAAGLPLFAWLRGLGAGLPPRPPRAALDGLLLALGTGLLLLPGASPAGLSPGANQSRLRRVARRLGGAWLAALAALAFGFCVWHGPGWTPATRVLAILLPTALAALPGSGGQPWLGLAAGTLLAAAWRHA